MLLYIFVAGHVGDTFFVIVHMICIFSTPPTPPPPHPIKVVLLYTVKIPDLDMYCTYIHRESTTRGALHCTYSRVECFSPCLRFSRSAISADQVYF